MGHWGHSFCLVISRLSEGFEKCLTPLRPQWCKEVQTNGWKEMQSYDFAWVHYWQSTLTCHIVSELCQGRISSSDWDFPSSCCIESGQVCSLKFVNSLCLSHFLLPAFSFFQDLCIFISYVLVFCLNVFLHITFHVLSARGIQKRALDPLKLKLHMTVPLFGYWEQNSGPVSGN